MIQSPIRPSTLLRGTSRRWILCSAVCTTLAAFGAAGCESRPEPPAVDLIEFEQGDSLSAWVEGPTKRAIVAFVDRITTAGPDFIPENERIAVFDNDGTLWAEQPLYTEFQFAIDRARALMLEKPELASHPAFAAIASGDPAAAAGLTQKDIAELLAATHRDTPTEAFPITVRNWLGSTQHPRFKRSYGSLVYEPQLQLLNYLRDAGFKIFIVSGGGVDFMRAFAEQAYGVPPEQVIGSSSRLQYQSQGGSSSISKTGEVGSIDDGPGKPENIALHIGRRPVIAVGNSDGDFEMLEYTAADGARPSLEVLIHHDDGQREYAYDRTSKIGKLDRALDAAASRGWLVVSMKNDWATIFPEPADPLP